MKKRVYPKREKTKRHPLLGVGAKLAKKFSLDELELRILLEAQSETFEEIAEELGVLPRPVEARVMRSIPAKLGTRVLNEARRRVQAELATI